MFNFHLSYKWVRWTRSTEPPPALPGGVERMFITTPSGELEMLYAAPRPQNQRAGPVENKTVSPLYFVHGGMGGAWVWLEYLEYFASKGIPCYAISLRGHGQSWHPSFLRMVYGTTKRALADDLVAGAKWVQQREGAEVVLVGHSSGGGLSQFVLSEGDLRAKGLALVAAVPGFGSMSVYINWWLMDPLFNIRMLFHGWHPNSPLSHPALTKAAFFSAGVSGSYLLKFQRQINAYESFLWPLGMMKPFVNVASLVQHLGGWGSGQRILVLGGGADKLMTVPVMQKLAGTYRDCVGRLVRAKKIDAGKESAAEVLRSLDGPGGLDTVCMGVRFCTVPGAGHHLQNDVQWETGAAKLLDFYTQL